MITPFSFSTVAHLICESGSSKRVGSVVHEYFPKVRKALLVTDPGFLKTGLVEPIVDSLRNANIAVEVWAEVEADPSDTLILKAVNDATQHAIDLVIGVGGGSSMDVAKLIAVLVNNDQPLEAMYGIGNVKGPRLPLLQIPTTAGTGSEVTHISIVTTGATTKMGVVASQLYADLVILDAELTVGLPKAISAATGIDAMVHAIEAYTSKIKKNPLSDMLAMEALRLLSANIVTVCDDGANLPARQAMLLGAMLAGQAFSNAPVAAVHALAYPIGGIFHVPHGMSNALVLPHVLRFNAPAATQHYAELATILAPEAVGTAEARALAMIEATASLCRRVGIPASLQAVGITSADLDRLSDSAMLQTRLLGNNPRTVDRTDAHAIYTAALNG